MAGGVKSERLRSAREKAGFASAADAARQFGWTESAYRHHENGIRGFGADAAKKYGRAFRVTPAWLLALDKAVEAAPDDPVPEDRLFVNGAVAAGVWREPDHFDDERAFEITGSQAPVPNARRFGMEVEGRSMDVFYEPRSVLDCVSTFKNGPAPQTGDHVIVERQRPDGLRELTVKEYLEDGGRYYLVPRSTRPEFQEPIEIGQPDRDHVGDDRVQVIGFVVGSYPPRAIDLMRRMGIVRQK